MGILCYLHDFFDDLRQQLCANKFKFVICLLASLAGIGVGIGFFYAFQCGWWYFNRISFADKLIQGGFGVFLLFLFTTALIYLGLVLCSLFKGTHYLSLFTVFVASFYCGATIVALFTLSVMWGVLYIAFIALENIIIWSAACFACLCEKAICRTFRESVCDCKTSATILIIGLIYKILAFFVVIKLLTSVI